METKREIVSSGPDVESAIAAGLEALGVERDAVEIDVLNEGSRGLLGIGARQASVQLTVKVVAPPAQEPSVKPIPEPALELEPAPAEVEVTPAGDAPVPADTEEAELENVAPVARQTLIELLEKMGIQAQVEDYVRPSQDKDDYPKLMLNIQGRDLGALIGRRGETLNALQYLTRLIVGREVERRVNLVVDVEGYRVRRESSLQKMAHSMAERAVATGRRQVLEPMSPAERRIVHVALRNHQDVVTESVGQGESRKVTIFLRGSR